MRIDLNSQMVVTLPVDIYTGTPWLLLPDNKTLYTVDYNQIRRSGLFILKTIDGTHIPSFPITCAVYYNDNLYMTSNDGVLMKISTDMMQIEKIATNITCYSATVHEDALYFYSRMFYTIQTNFLATGFVHRFRLRNMFGNPTFLYTALEYVA